MQTELTTYVCPGCHKIRRVEVWPLHCNCGHVAHDASDSEPIPDSARRQPQRPAPVRCTKFRPRVGSELTAITAALGFDALPEYEGSTCDSCRDLAMLMDWWGVRGCQRRRSLIAEHLKTAAAGRSWWEKARAVALSISSGIVWNIDPTDRFGSLVDLAIARAEAKRPTWSVPTVDARTINSLAVITTYFNPQGYARIRENYHAFAEQIHHAGLPLYTAELAFDADPFTLPRLNTLQIRGFRERNLLWQKERLLNILVERLPAAVDAVAWVDADVIFQNPQWVQATCDALAKYSVVQMFHQVYQRHPAGRRLERFRNGVSVGWAWHHRPDKALNFRVSHPGFAWAARRDWLTAHGLYDRHVTGGGDCVIAQPCVAGGKLGLENKMSSAWAADAVAWVRSADAQGALGYVPGDIHHLAHGTLANRRYVERWRYLADHGYDPAADLVRDESGLWAWSWRAVKEKPAMVKAVGEYFGLRRDDD